MVLAKSPLDSRPEPTAQGSGTRLHASDQQVNSPAKYLPYAPAYNG